MHFLMPIPIVIFTQMYWASLVFIGFVYVHAFYRLRKKALPGFWLKAPFFAKLLMSFAASAAIFAIWTLIGYGLALPSWWLGVSYGATAFVAIIYALVAMRRGAVSVVRLFIKNMTRVRLFSAVTVLLVVVACDYWLNLHTGSYLLGDAPVHMSKLRHLAQSGFTLTDAYFGTVPETRHTLSVMHTLYAIPVYFGVSSVNSWFLALAPIKLFTWAAVFYLAWYSAKVMLVPKRWLISVAVVAVVVAISLSGLDTSLMTYPDRLVVIWLTLLVIGLIELWSSGRWILFLGASLLVATTHSLIAMASCILLVFISVGFLLFDRHSFTRRTVIALVMGALILASTPIFTYFLPNQMSPTAYDYASQNFHYVHVLGATAFMPSLSQYSGGGRAGLSWVLLGLFGFVALLWRVRTRSTRIIIGSFLLFTPLVLYNPLLFSGLHRVLPYWAIYRFTTMNVFRLIAIFLGVLAVVLLVVKLSSRVKKMLPVMLVVFSLVILVVFQPFAATNRWYLKGYSPQQYGQSVLYHQLTAMGSLTDGIPKGETVLAPTSESFRIPAVSPLHVLSITESSATPAADAIDRWRCQKKIFQKFSLSLMKQASVDYIVAHKSSSFYIQAMQRPSHFRFLKQNNVDALFQVVYEDVQAANDPICTFHE